MNILEIKHSSSLHSILWGLFEQSTHYSVNTRPFETYIESLDENIIECNWINSWEILAITFKDEQAKMFFILKYA